MSWTGWKYMTVIPRSQGFLDVWRGAEEGVDRKAYGELDVINSEGSARAISFLTRVDGKDCVLKGKYEADRRLATFFVFSTELDVVHEELERIGDLCAKVCSGAEANA